MKPASGDDVVRAPAEDAEAATVAEVDVRGAPLCIGDVRRILDPATHGVHPKAAHLALYQQAFVHRSCACNPDDLIRSNERLEFLGDAVLSLITAEYLYERFPRENEGFLTRLRSKIVSGRMLSQLAHTLHFYRYVRLAKQVEASSGRRNHRILEDAFEAFVGAMYLSSGFVETKRWFVGFLENNVDVTSLVLTQDTYKDILVRFFHESFNCQPKYVEMSPVEAAAQEVEEEGSSGSDGSNSSSTQQGTKRVKRPEPLFVVGIEDNWGRKVGSGCGPTRRLAVEQASRSALEYYSIIPRS